MGNHYIDEQEQTAIKHHTLYYKVHTFYIKSVEEYITMEPFIKMFPNVKLILARNLRNGLLKIMVARYKSRKYKRDWQAEYRKRKQKRETYITGL